MGPEKATSSPGGAPEAGSSAGKLGAAPDAGPGERSGWTRSLSDGSSGENSGTAVIGNNPGAALIGMAGEDPDFPPAREL
jgi:hypothetical protein